MDNLKIELLTQNWIDGNADNDSDSCSHGMLLVKINYILLSDENTCEWTVASSSLRLMKSAIYGYNSKDELELIPCCGYLRQFPSCPDYITWDAKINEDIIVISNIQSSRNEKNGLKVINDSFEIEYQDYVYQILKFATKIKDFYSSCDPRTFYDKFDEEEYNLFWSEFDEYYEILKRNIL